MERAYKSCGRAIQAKRDGRKGRGEVSWIRSDVCNTKLLLDSNTTIKNVSRFMFLPLHVYKLTI